MLKHVKYSLFSLIFIACSFASLSYANKGAVCKLSEQDTFREGLIELGDLACDDFLDCVLILNFPKEHQNTKFKKISLMVEDDNGLVPALLASEVKDHLSSVLYGSQDFLTSLKFRIVFEPVKGCSFWSTLILE